MMNSGLLENKKILVAVSTGVDSMVLLHKLLKINCEVFVIHVNHQVREESKKEEEFIKNYCEERGVPLFIRHFKYSSGNFQMKAREYRYECFCNLYRELNLDMVVTAHHKNDYVETVVMRLMRGTSIVSLNPFEEITKFNDVCIVRPLINYTKSDLYKYANENNVKFFEDVSNLENKYLRNRVRNTFVNHLEEYELDNIVKFGLETLELSNYIESEVSKLIEKYCDTFITLKNNSFLVKSAIQFVFKNYYNCYLGKVSKATINRIMDFISSDSVKMQLFDDLFVYQSNNYLVFSKNITDEYSVIVKEEEQIISFINSKLLLNNGSEKLKISSDVKLPLKVVNADLNMYIELKNGRQKLNRLFIDKKIAERKRRSWPVLLDAENKVVAVFGIKKSIYCDNSVINYGFMLQYECIFKGDDYYA